jgi:dihydroxyacetone kinase-like protein
MAGTFARLWLTTFTADFDESKDELGDLDRRAGDGDFAVNLASALRRTHTMLTPLDEGASAAEIFAAASTAFLHTGGTSGPLLGMWLRDIGKAFSDASDPVRALASGVAAGTATVQRLGGAQPGDKTMVDAMVPAVDALQAAHRDSVGLSSALDRAAAAAEDGAAKTEAITASLGRASYVGDVSVGVMDPGAAAIALLFRSGHKAADETSSQGGGAQ